MCCVRVCDPQQLFEQYVDANAVVVGLQRTRPNRMTPKMFMHTLKSMCRWGGFEWHGRVGGRLPQPMRLRYHACSTDSAVAPLTFRVAAVPAGR